MKTKPHGMDKHTRKNNWVQEKKDSYWKHGEIRDEFIGISKNTLRSNNRTKDHMRFGIHIEKWTNKME